MPSWLYFSALPAHSAVKILRIFFHFFSIFPKNVPIFLYFSLFFAFFLYFSSFFSIFFLPILPKPPKLTHQPSFSTQKTTSPFKINAKFPPFFKNSRFLKSSLAFERYTSPIWSTFRPTTLFSTPQHPGLALLCLAALSEQAQKSIHRNRPSFRD